MFKSFFYSHQLHFSFHLAGQWKWKSTVILLCPYETSYQLASMASIRVEKKQFCQDKLSACLLHLLHSSAISSATVCVHCQQQMIYTYCCTHIFTGGAVAVNITRKHTSLCLDFNHCIQIQNPCCDFFCTCLLFFLLEIYRSFHCRPRALEGGRRENNWLSVSADQKASHKHGTTHVFTTVLPFREVHSTCRSCINITAEVLVGACGNTHWHKMHSEALNADSISLFTAMHIVCDGYCHQIYSLFCNI